MKIALMGITTGLLGDISDLIDRAKNHLSTQFNSTLVLLNWEIGFRIDQEILKHKRADYGKRIIPQLAKELQIKYGRGFDRASLFRMVQLFPDQEIVATLSQQLSWSHFVEIIAISDDLKRSYYLEMCRIERWSVRTLRSKIDTMLYERTALAKKPEDFIKQSIKQLSEENTLAPEFIFHDPYFLNFVELPSSHSETDLENTILDELIKFLQEFGNDFCFVTRQKRMSTKATDRYLDLLFVRPENLVYEYQKQEKSRFSWWLNSASLDIGVTVWPTFRRVGNSLKCKHGTKGDNSKLNRRSLRTKLNMVTQETCVRTVVRSEYAKGVDTHKPKWCEAKEESEMNRSDLNVLSLRRKAGTYVQRETKSWNGITIIGALSKLSRWPVVCSIMEGLSQKLMPEVMFGIC